MEWEIICIRKSKIFSYKKTIFAEHFTEARELYIQSGGCVNWGVNIVLFEKILLLG